MKILHTKEDETRSISSAEALAIVERIRMDPDRNLSSSFQSILSYLRMIPSPRNSSWAERVRRVLNNGGLTEKEATQIIDLSPERSIEAKSLVPSLERIDSYSLDTLLNDVAEIPMN